MKFSFWNSKEKQIKLTHRNDRIILNSPWFCFSRWTCWEIFNKRIEMENSLWQIDTEVVFIENISHLRWSCLLIDFSSLASVWLSSTLYLELSLSLLILNKWKKKRHVLILSRSSSILRPSVSQIELCRCLNVKKIRLTAKDKEKERKVHSIREFNSSQFVDVAKPWHRTLKTLSKKIWRRKKEKLCIELSNKN